MTGAATGDPAPAGRSVGRGVVVIGDVMTDVVVRAEGALVTGSDRRAAIRIVPGGSGSNQAAWLAREGVPTRFVGRVAAADRDGLVRGFAAAGVEARLAADPVAPSGVIVAIVTPDGERSFFTDRGANDRLAVEDLPDAILEDIALVHLSGYALVAPGSRKAVLDLLGRARRRGIATAVDPASASFLVEIGPENFLDWTAGADLCVPNADEAAVLAGTADPAAQLAILAGRYATVVVKRGAAGAEAASGKARWSAAAPEVAAIDTTGAGDGFFAGFLAARLAGADMAAALARGVAAGARVTTLVGGRPPG